MAISHIGSSGTAVINSSTMSASVAVGLQAGDLILCVTSDRPGSTPNVSTIPGFTRLTPGNRISNSYTSIHYKIASGTETTITATLSGDFNVTGVLTVSVFRGVDQRFPIDRNRTRNNSSGDSNPIIEAIQPGLNECYLLGIITQAGPTGQTPNYDWSSTLFTELFETGTTQALHGIGLAGVQLVTNATVSTQTATSNVSGAWRTHAIALRPAYETYVRDDGATSYWKLDETTKNSGSTCTATIGSNLTYINTVSTVPGRVGNAAYFQATGLAGSTAPETSYTTHQDITLECWAAFYGIDGVRTLIGKRDASDSQVHYSIFSNGSPEPHIQIDLGTKRWVTTYVPVADRVYRHFCFTYIASSNLWRLYVNGTLVSEQTTTPGTLPTADASFAISRLPGNASSSFQGGLDEVAVYIGTSLTVTQVMDHYKAGIPKGVKVWNGSSYVERPYRVRNSSGGYVEAPVKIWNGTHWIDK